MSKVLLVVYDNKSYIHCFPIGTGYIAAVLKNKGHQVDIYNQDVYHWDEDHLTNYIEKTNPDVIGLGIIGGYYQYKKLLKISSAIKSSNWNGTYILGGPGVSPEPEYFLKKTGADYIVHGEAEGTIVDLIDNLGSTSIQGTSCFSDGKFIKNKSRKLIDINDLPFPAYELFPINYYALSRQPGFAGTDRVMGMISSRGCPYRCNFCYKMDSGYRLRSTESIVSEIEYLKKTYDINAIEFLDELLMCNSTRAYEISKELKKLNIKWVCNGRLNVASRSQDLLDFMKSAGCQFINYGIESVDDKCLEIMGKKLTVEQIIKGIEHTNNADIIPGLNIIWGNIGEGTKQLKKDVKFLKKYNKGGQFRTIRPVTPYPGSELYNIAIEKGLLEGPEDFYEKKHLNSDLLAVNFTSLSDKQFHNELKKANLELIKDYYKKKRFDTLNQCEALYDNKNINFRGFRQD